MRIFRCPTCGLPLYFHNHFCVCGTAVAFDPEAQAFEVADQVCANRTTALCNWRNAPGAVLCRSCAMTRTIPDQGLAAGPALWAEAESAKRWVLTGLNRLGWLNASDVGPPPVFDLVAEETQGGAVAVTMGHAEGVITLNVSEADPALIAARKAQLGEPYRTMLGHVRHELAHYLHMRLLAEDATFAQAFRDLFGDERADYAAALQDHYARPQDTDGTHITSYATAHPHEDWAETTAHLLHLLDIADSFHAAGLMHALASPDRLAPGSDAYASTDTERVITDAAAAGLALNHVNRSMGMQDLYPFVLADGVREKLAFVHARLRR